MTFLITSNPIPNLTTNHHFKTNDMKLYISGKISGLPINSVIEKFKWHKMYLTNLGHDVVNPLEVCPFDESKTWIDYMKEDISELLSCEAIYMLKDWGQSKGARIEYAIAKELGLTIYFEGDL